MDLSVSDAPVGRLLDGRYRVESLLARGGMATVYRATDTRLDRTVALKVMHAELAADDDFVDRFIGEARSAARLSNPHIVGVFDQGEDQGAVFLAMEYVQGRTLRDLLRERGRLDAGVTLEILEAVLAALWAAHEANIVHRDIKPENVLISDDGRVKVADFGLARPSTGPSNATTRGLLLGTVNYISPEQALGERATSRSDVYSAGIMLYELLTGRPPHTGPTDFVVVRAHIDEAVPPPSEAAPVPGVVDELVLTATARDPQARYADAGAFLAAVRLARATMASGEAHDGPGRHASAGALQAPAPPTAGTGRDAAGPIEVAEAFHRDSGQLGPFRDRDDAPGSNPIDLANAFYHETTPPPPPPPHSRTGTARTRVIQTADSPPPGHIQSAHAAGAGAAGSPDDGSDEPSRAQRRAQAQSQRRWRGPILFVLVLLLAAAVTIGAWWFGAGRWTSTPALLNLEPSAAIAAAEEAGLSATADGEAYSERVEAGLVVRTEPAPGEQILRGGTVTLIISQGPERYEVPDVNGMTREQAETALGDRNLVPNFTERHDADADEGTVVSQDIEPGEEVRPDTEVTVVLSLGPEPIDITDFVGRSGEEARQQLTDDGFEVDVDQQYSDDVAAGLVISQEPRDGTGFAGDEIALVVSRGPEIVEIDVPDVRGWQLKDAERHLKDAGFEVEVESSFPGRGRDRLVLNQEPAGGTAPQGTTVTLYVL